MDGWEGWIGHLCVWDGSGSMVWSLKSGERVVNG